MRPSWRLNDRELFGSDVDLGEKSIHVLVEPPTIDDGPTAKRPRVDTTVAELWDLSELKLAVLPSPRDLAALLQQPLPFRLTLRDSVVARDIFQSDGAQLSCANLSLWMDNFLDLCDSPPEKVASENSWQEIYDALLRIPRSLLHAKKVWVRGRRNIVDTSRTTMSKKRPDYILHYKGLVLMRGEEKSTLVDKRKSLAELTSKMRWWNPMFYGDLPYILGYATSGDDLEVVAIERSGEFFRTTKLLEFSVFEQRADALKLFYNLAFLLKEMVQLTTRSYANDLTPFVPDDNGKRTITLQEDSILRTINLTQCNDASDFERLIDVYKTLELLKADGSTVTHLQTVDNLSLKRNGRLVVELSPVGYVRDPKINEVSEWLQHMLTALEYWHRCKYCHGDLRARNIVFVPTGGSGYWMLIDMDESRRPGTTAIHWNHESHGSKLRFQHDLYQFGTLMGEFPFELPDNLKAMQRILQSAVNMPEFTAEVALAKLAEHFQDPSAQ